MIVERLDPGHSHGLANNTNRFICGARASIQSARSIVLRGGANYGGLGRDDGAPAAAADRATREVGGAPACADGVRAGRPNARVPQR